MQARPDGIKDASIDAIANRYEDYHALVNMSASELERWASTKCSTLASESRAPIERNLRLLRTAKNNWGQREFTSAGRTISFVSRMREMPKGTPAQDGCPSQRDISLKNWAYDPDKSQGHTEGDTKASPDALSVGDYVRWSSSGGTAQGRITRIVRDGSLNVPDSVVTITGTPDDPAALIRIYRQDDDGAWNATDTQVGHKFSTLTKINALKANDTMSTRQQKSFSIASLKVDVAQGVVTAIVSVFGNIDHGDDIVHRGAFKKTIAERAHKVRVLDNHNMHSVRDVIGKLESIREVGRNELPASVLTDYPDATGGLEVVIQFMMTDPDSKAVFDRIDTGAIDEYSFAFDIMQYDYEDVTTDQGKRRIRHLRELKLYEVSPVIFGMNSATTTVGSKNNVVDQAKAAPNYRLADGTAMCNGCAFYAAVTDDKGYCKAYDMVCEATMVCDAYDGGTPERQVADDMREQFETLMRTLSDKYFEMGAWSDDEKQQYADLIETVIEAIIEMYPPTLVGMGIPQRDVMTAPKSEADAAPQHTARTSQASDNAPQPARMSDARKQALIESIRIRQRMADTIR